MSVRKKTASGIFWMSLDVLMIRGLTFITSILLARLLSPEEFGLVGMLLIFIAIGTTLVESGLSESLIRTIAPDQRDFSSVFYVNILLSLLAYLILYFTAPWIADFYGVPALVSLARAYGVTFVLSGLSVVQSTILLREHKFKKLMLLNLPGSIAGASVGLYMGYSGSGVWSIIFMYLTIYGVQALFLWLFSTWRPSWVFSRKRIIYHLNFGYKLLLSGLINAVFNNLYNVIIGKFFAVRLLGYYERSYAFSQQPVMILSGVLAKVTYPIMAEIRENKDRVSNMYRLLFQTSFFLAAPIMIIAAALAKPIFSYFLGPAWEGAATFFQILCMASVFYPINAFNLNILKVYGRTDLFLKLEVIKKAIMSAGLAIGFYFGIVGLLWSLVAAAFMALLVNASYSAILIGYGPVKQLKDMAPIALISGLTYILLHFLSANLDMETEIIRITLLTCLGIGVYLLLALLLKIPVLSFIKGMIKNHLRP
jgi:O-antigen/teichoic acid export membrane protein